MPINSFDHINIRTANLDAMVEWYAEALGLTAGDRPADRLQPLLRARVIDEGR